MFVEIGCLEFANLLDKPLVFLDKKGRVVAKNDYYKKNYQINEFDNPKVSIFEGTLLSSEHKERLKSNGRASLDVLLSLNTNTLSKIFPSKRLLRHRFLHLVISAFAPEDDNVEYVIAIVDNTASFNSDIDMAERTQRWRHISVLGKQAYFQYDINSSSWTFSDNFFKFSGKSIDRKEDKNIIDNYLNALSQKDRKMIREQWQLSLTDSRPGDVFEYTFPILVNGEERFHSARWSLYNDPANPVMYGLLMDINELTRTENALNDSLSQMALLAGIEDLVLWNYFPQTRTMRINKEVSNDSILEEFDIKEDEFPIENILNRVLPEHKERIEKDYKSIISGEIYSTNLKTRIKNQKDIYIFVVTNFVLQKTDSKGEPLQIVGLSKFGLTKEEKSTMEEKKTILIAEDIDNNYDLLNIILRKDYKLVRAVNGVEAVKLFSEIKPDLILMDMKMPEMGGLEATRLIRMESQDVPIIAVTAFAFESDREVAIEAGCNDFLSKPIDIPVLKALIKRFLDK